jgi:hypothetical protein
MTIAVSQELAGFLDDPLGEAALKELFPSFFKNAAWISLPNMHISTPDTTKSGSFQFVFCSKLWLLRTKCF